MVIYSLWLLFVYYFQNCLWWFIKKKNLISVNCLKYLPFIIFLDTPSLLIFNTLKSLEDVKNSFINVTCNVASLSIIQILSSNTKLAYYKEKTRLPPVIIVTWSSSWSFCFSLPVFLCYLFPLKTISLEVSRIIIIITLHILVSWYGLGLAILVSYLDMDLVLLFSDKNFRPRWRTMNHVWN